MIRNNKQRKAMFARMKQTKPQSNKRVMSNYTSTQKSEIIKSESNKLMDKYDLESGTDLKEYQTEFIRNLRNRGIYSIDQNVINRLEDDNYHTEIALIKNNSK